MDWGAGYLTVIVETGGGTFANESCPQGQAFDHFSNARGFARGLPWGLPGACPGVCPGEMLAAGIDSHITEILFKSSFHELLCCMLDISSLCELHLE